MVWSFRRYVALLLPAALIVLPATCVISIAAILADWVTRWANWWMATMTAFSDWCKAPVYTRWRAKPFADDYGMRK